MAAPERNTAPRILIVDDDPASRLLMRSCLEKEGFEVIDAADGLIALDQFERHQPDAVLLDVMMPNMDGFDCCHELRKKPDGDNTPVLMVTGLDDIAAIHKAFNCGATDFISKPINWAILGYRVKYMLRASHAFSDVVTKQQQIQKLSFFDQLTGLANRVMLSETLETSLSANQAYGDNLLAVLVLDLDRFKGINDTLGHYAGDRLLKAVADRISSCIKDPGPFGQTSSGSKHHFLSRLGGDEFAILLPQLKSPDAVSRIARHINEHLARPFIVDDTEVFASASIGISIAPLDGNNAEELLKQADVAMYHAKEKGKNNFQFYKKSLNAQAREQLVFETDVRRAVQNDEFQLYYQPQIDLTTGRIIGAEALTRWHHATRGSVSPADFIPAVEGLGLIIPFTDWVIRHSGAQQLHWRQGGMPNLRIAINVSSQHFVEQKLPDKIAVALQDFNLNASFLELELTESVLADQSEETLEVLQRIKELGMTISVDDFGTGYSSMVYLKSFPIDIVKIDRYFIKDILTSTQDAAIVKAIIAMAHSMDIRVIAEGIEELGQVSMLQQMGCDYGQGFLFSRAVTCDDFAEMVTKDLSLIPEQ